jgi:hypothetical protein
MLFLFCCIRFAPPAFLQLAAALVWAKRRPSGQHFVCLDQRSMRDFNEKDLSFSLNAFSPHLHLFPMGRGLRLSIGVLLLTEDVLD